MPRKIAMVGTHPSGQGAPFDDPSWEIWGVSARAHYFTRATRWYEIHRLDGTFKKPGEADHWRKELTRQCAHQVMGDDNSAPVPLKMFYPEEGLGDLSPYPVQEITDRFGTFFMTSTFSWMLAEAINEIAPRGKFAEPGTVIGVWGIEMEYGTEYTHQRAGFRHFAKLAYHLGIDVQLRIAGGLIYEPVPYPFWQDAPHIAKLEERLAEASRNALMKEDAVRQARENLAKNIGALEALRGIGQTGEVVDAIKKLEGAYDNMNALLVQVSREEIYWKAIESEQKFWMDYYRP